MIIIKVRKLEVSPYPHVRILLIGHPERISKPEQYDMTWFDLVYCKILPPRGLYLPVLPYKQKTKQATKLLFGLCRTCMDRCQMYAFQYNQRRDEM